MSTPDAPQRLVILDGHGIIFRAYFAVREPLVVRKTGEVVTAVYGFTNTLLRVIDELKPTHIAVAMDTPEPTFRHEADPQYKAHRPPPPEDLPPQIDRCRDVIRAFNIPIFEQPGFEADDVLATLADQAVAEGVDTWLATLDSDLIQLVRPGVSVFMYRPYQRDTVRYDSDEKVRERYGIDPIQMIDFKGLQGDTSDNIPGVPGIGEKTAISLLNRFRTIEDMTDERFAEVIAEIQAEQAAAEKAANEDQAKLLKKEARAIVRAQKALRENPDAATHSKLMATIRHDVPVTFDLAASAVRDFNHDDVVSIFQELEFRTLIDRLPASMAVAAKPRTDVPEVATNYEIVRTAQALESWMARAKSAPLLAVDLETSSTDTMTCDIAGYALAVAPGEAAYIPVRHADDGQPLLDADVVKDALRPIIESPSIAKVLHNAKFDIKVLAQHGLHLRGLREDTMIAAYLLGESSIGLKVLARERLGVEMTPIEELIGKGKKQISMVEISASDAGDYAAADADMTLRLAAIYETEFEQEPRLLELYRTLELPLVEVLADMERTGVACDPESLGRLSETLDADIIATEKRIHAEVGHDFKISSPKQLSEVLFEELALPKTRKTTLGYTTDAQALERIAELHPVVELVLQYRELTKLKSTYVDALPKLINPNTGRIHTDYNQTVAATGRLSSENPHLQNIPVRTEQGREIRRAFHAHDGEDATFLGADYSQIELRVLAHLSEDAGLIAAFRDDEDIHAATASGVYGVAPADVDAEMRRVAKMMNFGVIYGLTAHGLSQRAGMERRAAQDFIDAYFERFSRVQEWIEEVKESTKKMGYAETLLGRRRYLPEIRSSNFQVRSAAERMAVNMPVQGTAADVMKRAMLLIQDGLQRREMAARMILQVHDELIFELPQGEVQEVAALLEEAMPSAIEMVVPLKIEQKMGPNWRDMESFDPEALGADGTAKQPKKAKTPA